MLSNQERFDLMDLSRIRRNKKLMTAPRMAQELTLKAKASAKDQARIYGVIFPGAKQETEKKVDPRPGIFNSDAFTLGFTEAWQEYHR